jgi:hypothetical protein
VVDLARSFYQQVTPLPSLRHTPEMIIPLAMSAETEDGAALAESLIKALWQATP